MNKIDKINKEKAKELLINLVKIPSVTKHENNACDYLVKAIKEFGWENSYCDEAGNVIASRGSGEREIILMGHIDTVPGGPIFCVEKNIIWGRGAVDAKGPLASFVIAGGSANILPGWKLILIAAVGEEGDSKGALHVLPLYKPVACVIGEPSGTTGITIGYRGYLRIKLHAHDSGAHRSGDAGPLTACLMSASDILHEIALRDDTEKAIIERPSGAVIAMQGQDEGERSGVIDLDIRIPVGVDSKDWAEEFIKIGQQRGVNAELVASMPAYVVKKDDPLVRAMRISVREAGFNPRLLAKGGTADFNIAAAWHCPMVAYGPGDSKLDHTSKEHIDLNEYLQASHILKNALENFMGFVRE